MFKKLLALTFLIVLLLTVHVAHAALPLPPSDPQGLPSFGNNTPSQNNGLPSGLKRFEPNKIEKRFVYSVVDGNPPSFNVTFNVTFGKKIGSYKMEVVDKKGLVVKAPVACSSKDKNASSASCSWNGTDESCAPVASGDYKFKLSYGKGYKQKVESDFFNARLDTDYPGGYNPSCDLSGI